MASDGITEHTTTAFTPHDIARLSRVFGTLPYMHGLSARLSDCQNVGDLVKLLEQFRDNVVAAAGDAQKNVQELTDLRHTLKCGGKLLKLLLDGQVSA